MKTQMYLTFNAANGKVWCGACATQPYVLFIIQLDTFSRDQRSTLKRRNRAASVSQSSTFFPSFPRDFPFDFVLDVTFFNLPPSSSLSKVHLLDPRLSTFFLPSFFFIFSHIIFFNWFLNHPAPCLMQTPSLPAAGVAFTEQSSLIAEDAFA